MEELLDSLELEKSNYHMGLSRVSENYSKMFFLSLFTATILKYTQNVFKRLMWAYFVI